jgi:DeoR family transcriptional regulator, aga operon transcriptional repressor
MSIKTQERGEQIMKALLRQGNISVEELVVQIGTSAPSVRRDLTRLERRGLICRTHGGATLLEPMIYGPFRHDTSFAARELRFADEKRRIGVAASELVFEKETIGLTAGTTTTQVGRSLRHRQNIHVVTNALNIGMELSNQSLVRTTITGGVLALDWTFAMAGPAALTSLNDIYFDKVFIGVTGLHIDHGVTTLEVEEAMVIRTMVKRAKHVIVVTDSSKLQNVSPAVICSLASIHTIVTDNALPSAIKTQLQDCGIRVILA